MTLLKVIEVLAESDQSWEDAARRAVKIASRSVRNIRSIRIKSFDATVSNDEIRVYRVNAKIAFSLEASAD
jgi:dodecin